MSPQNLEFATGGVILPELSDPLIELGTLAIVEILAGKPLPGRTKAAPHVLQEARASGPYLVVEH
jgi:hypothetical protein